MLVGGTGLYLRAVIDGLKPPPEFPDIAAELEAGAVSVREPATGVTALHARLAELDPLAASRMEATNLAAHRAGTVGLLGHRAGVLLIRARLCRPTRRLRTALVGIEIDRDVPSTNVSSSATDASSTPAL